MFLFCHLQNRNFKNFLNRHVNHTVFASDMLLIHLNGLWQITFNHLKIIKFKCSYKFNIININCNILNGCIITVLLANKRILFEIEIKHDEGKIFSAYSTGKRMCTHWQYVLTFIGNKSYNFKLLNNPHTMN